MALLPARAGAYALFAVLGVVVAVGLVLVASPRHRAFYLGRVRPDHAPADTTTTALEPSRGSTVRTVSTGPRPLGPDRSGRILVPLSDPMPSRLPADGVPLGWQLKEFTGRAVISLVRDGAQPALRLHSDHGSFAVYRDVVADLSRTPRLAWSWKVIQLPRDGDVRSHLTDDQAAQIYVIFPRWPSPLSQSDVLGYVWDSRAPVDTRVTSTKAANVRVIVVKSGAHDLGTWQREVRDVAEDYAAVFGRKAPRVGKVALMVDANDTRSEAEALFGELMFMPAR